MAGLLSINKLLGTPAFSLAGPPSQAGCRCRPGIPFLLAQLWSPYPDFVSSCAVSRHLNKAEAIWKAR